MHENHRRIALQIALTAATLGSVAPVAAQEPCLYFPETRQQVCGTLLDYWQTMGGLPVFGYPTGRQIGNAQEFERTEMELNPENPAPYNVLLALIGSDALQRNGIDWKNYPPADPSSPNYFPETEQAISPIFASYWEGHGLEFDGEPGKSFRESLALFGLPLTPAILAISKTDGKVYLEQHFERARFEFHPEAPGGVLLGLLGNEAKQKVQAPVPSINRASAIRIYMNPTTIIFSTDPDADAKIQDLKTHPVITGCDNTNITVKALLLRNLSEGAGQTTITSIDANPLYATIAILPPRELAYYTALAQAYQINSSAYRNLVSELYGPDGQQILSDYRRFVLAHELYHACYRGHQKWSSELLMPQMAKALQEKGLGLGLLKLSDGYIEEGSFGMDLLLYKSKSSGYVRLPGLEEVISDMLARREDPTNRAVVLLENNYSPTFERFLDTYAGTDADTVAIRLFKKDGDIRGFIQFLIDKAVEKGYDRTTAEKSIKSGVGVLMTRNIYDHNIENDLQIALSPLL